jgi:type IV pilus assembly protein PilV
MMKNQFISRHMHRPHPRDRGFSLIEVLIALLVISFGLLGVAGMQALSISNTGVAGYRSIAALQASSLAAAMEANQGYWANSTQVTLGTLTTVNNTTISGGNFSGGVNCSTSSCNPMQMASYDLQNWGATLASVLPNGYGTVICTNQPNGIPICQIMIYWVEKAYAQNQSSTGVAANAGTTFHLEMTVQP